jgi:hypothetical protein
VGGSADGIARVLVSDIVAFKSEANRRRYPDDIWYCTQIGLTREGLWHGTSGETTSSFLWHPPTAIDDPIGSRTLT